MLIPFACKLAFHNPVDEGQVRRVSGAGSPAWDNIESSTANNLVTPAQIGTTAWYEFALPAGLSADVTYAVSVFPTAAADATGTPDSAGIVGPANEAGVSSQFIANAMLLAPVGIAVAGSVQARLAALLTMTVGEGDIRIDHNHGGEDNYRVLTSSGAAADDVELTAYLRSEYDDPGAQVNARQYTGSDGRWLGPMFLDAGEYYLVHRYIRDPRVPAYTRVLDVA